MLLSSKGVLRGHVANEVRHTMRVPNLVVCTNIQQLKPETVS